MEERKGRQMLEPKFLRKLDNLRITAKNIFHGRMKGERRSPKRGASVEFADYRNYQIGDDFRHVDWNIYARLDKLFLKLFMEEENLNISIHQVHFCHLPKGSCVFGIDVQGLLVGGNGLTLVSPQPVKVSQDQLGIGILGFNLRCTFVLQLRIVPPLN